MYHRRAFKSLFQVDEMLIGALVQLAKDVKTMTDLWKDNLMLHVVNFS